MFALKSKPPGVPSLGMRLFLLSYALFIFLGPLLRDGTFREWAIAAVSLAPFLGLYAAVWMAIDDRRDRRWC